MEKKINFNPTVKIPTKIESKLRRVSKRRLGRIYSNTDLVIEAALTIASNLTNTYEISKDAFCYREKQGYKPLNSKILERQVKFYRDESSKYRDLLDLLIEEGIIEAGIKGEIGVGSNEYRLTNRYFGKKIVIYKMKQKETVNKLKLRHEANLRRVNASSIGRNALKTMMGIEFPTEKQILKVINKAVKDGYTNKKGKRLVWLGKHSKKTYPHSDFVYAEDYFNEMDVITRGDRIPIVGGKSSGGRVYTIYNMCNSLLRPLLTYKGQKLVEADYSCMHPQLIQTIYGEEEPVEIDHQQVADWLMIERNEAKIEHLSYFNKRTEGMAESILEEYYRGNFTEMMNKVEADKKYNTHKITSQRLFKLEVEIMTEVISRLDKAGIEALYVFDALYATKRDIGRVRQVMNKVAQEFGTTTRVK